MPNKCLGDAAWWSQTVVPGPAGSVNFGYLLEMRILGPHPRDAESKNLGVGPSNLYSSNPLSLAPSNSDVLRSLRATL